MEDIQPSFASRGKGNNVQQQLNGSRDCNVSEDHAFLMDPFVGSKFEDNCFVIMDKGASEISSCNEDSDTGMLNLFSSVFPAVYVLKEFFSHFSSQFFEIESMDHVFIPQTTHPQVHLVSPAPPPPPKKNGECFTNKKIKFSREYLENCFSTKNYPIL